MNWQTTVAISGAIFMSLFLLFYKYRRIMSNASDPQPSAPEFALITRSQTCSDLSLNSRDVCSICLTSFHYKVQTNCFHNFCANCFTSYWHVGNFVCSVSCPMCRTDVTFLTKQFTDYEEIICNEEKQRLINEVNCFNRLYSPGSRSWFQMLIDIPVILHHCFRQFMESGSLSILHTLRIILIFVVLIGYHLSPLQPSYHTTTMNILRIFDQILILATLFIYIFVVFRQFIHSGGEFDDSYF